MCGRHNCRNTEIVWGIIRRKMRAENAEELKTAPKAEGFRSTSKV